TPELRPNPGHREQRRRSCRSQGEQYPSRRVALSVPGCPARIHGRHRLAAHRTPRAAHGRARSAAYHGWREAPRLCPLLKPSLVCASLTSAPLEMSCGRHSLGGLLPGQTINLLTYVPSPADLHEIAAWIGEVDRFSERSELRMHDWALERDPG